MLRQPEFIHRPDMRVNHAENNFDAESLAHYTSAVTGELVRIRKIGITACLEFLFIHVRNKDRKSTRLNSSHRTISYAVFCLKKKNNNKKLTLQSENNLTTVILEKNKK